MYTRNDRVALIEDFDGLASGTLGTVVFGDEQNQQALFVRFDGRLGMTRVFKDRLTLLTAVGSVVTA